MSISLEYALENKNEPAVLCCRAEAGTVLSEHNLEDPAIFDDLVDSKLLNLDGAITIGQALGAKLTGTFDSLTPLTADKVEGGGAAVAEEAPAAAPAVEAEVVPVSAGSVSGASVSISGGILRINIQEGKGIHIELPIGE
ncbi:MAG: sugar transporter [Oscillospiraceae bacterium]